jgi:hypothetical protein
MGEGDKEIYEWIKGELKSKVLLNQFIDGKVWGAFENAIQKKITLTLQSLSAPDHLEFKSGMLRAFQDMLDWAKLIKKDIHLLSVKKNEMEADAKSAKQGGNE